MPLSFPKSENPAEIGSQATRGEELRYRPNTPFGISFLASLAFLCPKLGRFTQHARMSGSGKTKWHWALSLRRPLRPPERRRAESPPQLKELPHFRLQPCLRLAALRGRPPACGGLLRNSALTSALPDGQQRGADTRVCSAETRLGATPVRQAPRRDESRRCTLKRAPQQTPTLHGSFVPDQAGSPEPAQPHSQAARAEAG